MTDDNALSFTLDHIDQIFPQAKIIFSGVNDYSVINRLDKTRSTGVFEKKEIAPNIKLLRLIDPELSEIVVVGDGSNTYQSIEQEIKRELLKYPQIKAQYITNNNVDKLAADLGQQKIKYLFLTTIGAVFDNFGRQIGLSEIVNKIVSAGDFIVVSMEDAYIFNGVMGGYVTSGEQQGYTAANLTIAYENDAGISLKLPVIDSPNVYIFDYRELSKYNLKLPKTMLNKATILHQPVSFYEKNRTLILAVIYILTGLLVVIMAFFLSLLARKNKNIQAASDKISLQAMTLDETRNTLTEAQKIAHLGNWEWTPDEENCNWSDEIYRIFGEQPGSFTASFPAMLSYVYDDDRELLKSTIDNAIQNFQPYNIEHRLKLKDGSIKYIRQTGEVKCDSENKICKLIGIVLDISSMKNYELLEIERLARIERYQKALLDWSRTTYSSINEAFRRATEISAHTLDVNRVSIWLYNLDHTELECHDLYKLNSDHERIDNLKKNDFPNYFSAIESANLLIIPDARSDEQSKEFTESYLIPNDIFSMMDVPILYQGEVTGVVCHEHTGKQRQWKTHELEFASAISNTVSLSLEIEKRKQTEKALEHQAYHDVLTNLPNRSLFMDRLDQAIKLAHRTHSIMAVMFLDLDKFKEINDSLGHSVGDQVLISVARKLQSCLREVDTLSRLGGDEYSLIIGGINDSRHINDIASKLFNELQKPMNFNGHEIYVTSSIGISIYPEDGETADTLLRNADAAMYKAKDEGRNSFQYYTEDMTERAFERVLMESNLRRAIEREEFVVFYQPQHDANTDSIVGLEALVRWRHPEMGLVSPAKFIPVAEETGLIVQLDRWVFTNAVQRLSEWHAMGYNPGRLALNLAMKQLHQIDFIEFVIDTLQITACKPEWLAFEVTESQIMKKPEQAIVVLQKLSDLGIEIAVDDFGTGYSSLTYLKRLPVNKLKIDQSFIHDVPGDEEDEAIVCAVIALAKSMKLSVIAEGVEKEEQKVFLMQQGCNLIQGYFYARPMEAKELELRLKQI